ncbi:MAG: SWIM zinc finger family protein, partial [Roseburia hominis]
MFSVSDIKEDVYPAVYRRGKELYETGGVLDFAYDIYLEHDLPVAEVRAEVRGREQGSYRVTVVVDEEYGSVSSSNCTCEAFYNYEGMCKHCVAALLAYVNRRQAKDILAAKRTGHEVGEQGSAAEEKPAAPMQTAGAFKTLLNQYSLRAGVSYLIPESVYGKVELEPYFKMDYSYATVEFKIGMEQKYVLKNISAFLHSIERNEKVHYGKKLDFYHNRQAFTEDAWRMVEFMRMQDDDKKRQSRFHAYYAYTGGYERTMELDEVGIDRFFDAIGEMPLSAEIGYLPEEEYHVQEEERKPKLEIRAGASGVFLVLEDLHVIRGSRFYYFYEDGMIYRSSEALKAKAGDFFDYMERQTGGECYIA